MTHLCQKLVEAAKFLESSGFTQKQLSALHYFSLKGRDVSYASTYRYFGEDKELQRRNQEFSDRVVFVAEQYKALAGNLSALSSAALQKWPLRW